MRVCVGEFPIHYKWQKQGNIKLIHKYSENWSVVLRQEPLTFLGNHISILARGDVKSYIFYFKIGRQKYTIHRLGISQLPVCLSLSQPPCGRRVACLRPGILLCWRVSFSKVSSCIRSPWEYQDPQRQILIIVRTKML